MLGVQPTWCRDVFGVSRGVDLEPGFGEQLAQPPQAGEHPALDRAQRLAEPLGQLRLREPAVVGELDRLALVGRELAQRLLDDLALRAQPRLLVGRLAGRLDDARRSGRRGGAPRGGRGRPRGGGRASGSRCSACRARRGTSPPSATPPGIPPARRPRPAPGRARSAAPARRRPGRSGRTARRAPPSSPRETSASSASSDRWPRSFRGLPGLGSLRGRSRSRSAWSLCRLRPEEERSGRLPRPACGLDRDGDGRAAQAPAASSAASEPRSQPAGDDLAAGDHPDLVRLAGGRRRQVPDGEHRLARAVDQERRPAPCARSGESPPSRPSPRAGRRRSGRARGGATAAAASSCGRRRRRSGITGAPVSRTRSRALRGTAGSTANASAAAATRSSSSSSSQAGQTARCRSNGSPRRGRARRGRTRLPARAPRLGDVGEGAHGHRQAEAEHDDRAERGEEADHAAVEVDAVERRASR